MKILITGPQGSGKSTQAKLLAEELNIPTIDIGQILRDFSKSGDEKALAVKEAMNKGTLAPDQIAADLMRERMGQSSDFVADGYPRSIGQLTLFDPCYDLVFYLEIADKVVRQRLLRRGRLDDNPEVIDERLRNYHKLTEPVLSKFQSLGILSKIDANLSIDNINKEILKIVKGDPRFTQGEKESGDSK